jgi:MFS family permease
MTNAASPKDSQKVAKRNPFAVLLSDKDGRRFCLSAMVARLPMSMMSLGTVLAIRAIYHDWTAAGTVSAVYVLSAALVTPFYARCFDRFGQRKTGNIALPLSNIFLLAYILAMVFRLPLWLIYIFAIGLGLTQFSFGALARTRWTWLLRHRVSTGDLTRDRASSLLGTAFALESAIDEFLFVIGPILATTMASINPISQLVLPLVAQVVGGTIFFALKSANVSTRSLQHITVQAPSEHSNSKDAGTAGSPDVLTREPGQPPINDQQRLELLDAGRKNAIRKMLRRTETRTALGFPGILTLVCMFAIYNSSFSAYDVSVVALYEAQGKKALSGVLLAIYSVGSLVGALIYGSRTWKMPLWVRLITLMTGLVFGFILIDLVKGNVWLFIPAAFLAGMVISPTYATANMIVEDNVPGTFLTEGLSWMNTASSVGSSIGSTLVGIVLDHWGVQYSFAISWLAVLVATIFVIAARPWTFTELKMYWRSRHPQSSSPSAKRSRVA